MGMTMCLDCGAAVSTAALACMKCGRPMRRAHVSAGVPKRGSTGATGSVFWGIFHFFVTLPVCLTVGCVAVSLCTGAVSQ